MNRNFYDSYKYLEEHFIFQDMVDCSVSDCLESIIYEPNKMFLANISMFKQCLDVNVVKIDPVTDMISRNKTLNTKTEIWLECGPYTKEFFIHDIDLDCGGDTFEEAIIKLAKLVENKYTNNDEYAESLIESNYGNIANV